MDNASKLPLTVNKFGRLDGLKPSDLSAREAPPSTLVITPDPRETAQSTVHQVTARADLTPAEQATSDAPLPTNEPSHHANGGNDDQMRPTEKRA